MPVSNDSIVAVAPRQAAFGDLAASVPGARLTGDPATVITGIRFDSRLVRPGDLFAALPGGDFDGHGFIPGAIERGAAAVLCERALDLTVPSVLVADARAALAPVAAAFYGHPSRELTAIGLTGTDGKTTTSYLVDGILRAAGRTTGLIGTVAIRLGPERELHLAHQTTPESSLVQAYLRAMVETGVDTAILEATSHGLALHRLDGTRFAIAGVTNITHEHLEFHKTIAAYRRAKAILLERVAESRGTVVLNADDEGARAVAPHAAGAEIVWFSTAGAEAQVVATDVEVRGDGSTFTLHLHGQQARVTLPLVGGFNIANALCAAGIGHAAGVALATITDALAQAKGVPGRMNRVALGQPFDVIVDYAHTPDSLHKILSLLKSLHPAHRLIVVTGSAGERDPTKRPLQGAVCAALADISIFTSEDPRNEDPDAIIREIAAGAAARGGVAGETFHEVTDRREAIALAFSLAAPGDCVLLAGKGHETSIIWGYEHVPWDEAAVAAALLRARWAPAEG